MEQRTGKQPETSSSSSRIDWVRQPLQQARPSVVVYAIPGVLDTIRATLHVIGGDVALESFRSRCFGHFLDYRAGMVQKKAIHGLMSREVRVSDRALEGRETWFQIHHSQLRFDPTEYNLVSEVYGKRTTMKHLEDQFKAQAIARDAPDYMKVANILFAYRMILCLDQNQAVDPWVWAMVEDADRWNSFPWGGVLLPDADALHQHPPLQLRVVSFVPSPEEMATLYFRSMQLQAGAQSMRFVPPRSMNKKKLIANAASCCFSSAVDAVGPSAQGTRVARTPHKVRQGTSRPSSWALMDEPDPDCIPGLRPPAEEAAEHTTDPIHQESPPRAWGRKRSRRDRSQSSEEPSESFLQRVVAAIMPGVQEYVDRAIAEAVFGLRQSPRRTPTPSPQSTRSPTPPARSAWALIPPPQSALQPIVEPEGTSTSAPCPGGFSATYQLMNGIDDSSLQIAYSRFRLQGPDAVIQLYFNSDRLRQSWFNELEDLSTELKDVHMSYFLSAIAQRVWRDNGCPIMVANTGLYEALVGAWKTLHPFDPQCRQTYGDDDYRRWIPAEGLIHRIQGSDGRYQVPWKGCDYAIVVCDVADEHWVVVRIRFSDWVVELYDSLLYQMDDPSDRVHYERQDRELMPLLRLLPRLLICAGFWEGRQIPP
ncbi:hypothetical protein C2S52_020610 [Perilla frutescens var. hirtella]|nr:hypothetical protein C2S52_020610 [Perilla frutescens var. hirtella]